MGEISAPRAGRTDHDAWHAIDRALLRRLLAYFRVRLWAPHEPEEAVAETLARACEAIGRFMPAVGALDAWIFGIARNVVRERLRPAMRLVPLEESPSVGGLDGDPLQRVIDDEEAGAVRAAFELLPPSDRAVLRLRVIEGLDAQGTGRLLGKRPDAVRMAQMRAIRRLAALLAEETA